MVRVCVCVSMWVCICGVDGCDVCVFACKVRYGTDGTV